MRNLYVCMLAIVSSYLGVGSAYLTSEGSVYFGILFVAMFLEEVTLNIWKY
jgi:hypothetical protein